MVNSNRPSKLVPTLQPPTRLSGSTGHPWLSVSSTIPSCSRLLKALLNPLTLLPHLHLLHPPLANLTLNPILAFPLLNLAHSVRIPNSLGHWWSNLPTSSPLRVGLFLIHPPLPLYLGHLTSHIGVNLKLVSFGSQSFESQNYLAGLGPRPGTRSWIKPTSVSTHSNDLEHPLSSFLPPAIAIAIDVTAPCYRSFLDPQPDSHPLRLPSGPSR